MELGSSSCFDPLHRSIVARPTPSREATLPEMRGTLRRRIFLGEREDHLAGNAPALPNINVAERLP
jgi:hypothetical protein